jgi:hypothetical protein
MTLKFECEEISIGRVLSVLRILKFDAEGILSPGKFRKIVEFSKEVTVHFQRIPLKFPLTFPSQPPPNNRKPKKLPHPNNKQILESLLRVRVYNTVQSSKTEERNTQKSPSFGARPKKLRRRRKRKFFSLAFVKIFFIFFSGQDGVFSPEGKNLFGR